MLILLAGWAFCLGAVGGPLPVGRVPFRSLGLEQGLGNLNVWCLVQDAEGFIWAGTEDGVFRFDGQAFQAFGLKEGLPSTNVTCLHVDDRGVLWVGTLKGIARLTAGRFEAMTSEQGLPEGPVRDLASGSGGRLLVAAQGGLFERTREDRFRLVDGWPGGDATALWARSDTHAAWVASWHRGRPQVHRWAAGTWRTLAVEEGQEGERIDAVAQDGSGHVWARSPRRLWFGDGEGAMLRPSAFPVGAVGQRGCLLLDRKGRLWIPDDQGLVILEEGQLRRLGRAQGLPSRVGQALLEDREGGIWVGGTGVHQLLAGGAWTAHTLEEGLPHNMVWSVLRNRDGALLVGTDRGMTRAEGAGWKGVAGTEGFQVRTIVQAPDGTTFAAGSPVILKLRPGLGGLERLGRESGVDPGGRIFRLALDREGTLWTATEGAGLLRGRSEGGRWRFVREELPGGTPAERINDVWVDAADRVWVGGEHGLAVRMAGAWHRFTTREGLRANHIAYVRGRKDGSLLIAYFEPLGLCTARLEGGTLQVVGHLDDRIPVMRAIYLIGEDARGRIWVGTGQGVDVLHPLGQKDSFTRREGLVWDDTNAMAFLAEPNGDVWIGTSGGLAHLNAATYGGPPEAPPVAVLGHRFGEGAFRLGPPNGGIPQGRATLEVQFAAPTYQRPSSVQYQTRLWGLEPEWHITTSTRERYPQLRPGSYRFEVRARLGEGPWGPTRGYPFEVHPAWWQSLGFRALVLLAMGAAAIGVVRLRLRTLRRRNRQLEAMVASRTRELEQANEALRAQSLSDPLTGLRNRRYLGVVMPEGVAQTRRALRNAIDLKLIPLPENLGLVFIMVDLDHFKSVNDQFGHAAGDRVLKETSAILEGATRDTDTVIRWGGEEFLVVARNASRREATILVERIRSAMALHPFDLGQGEPLRRTCSLGFATFPFVAHDPDLMTWEQVAELADHCLLAAKRAGRDAWVGLYPTPQADPEQLRQRAPMDIAGLIRDGHLEVKSSVKDRERLNWETFAGR